MPSFSPEKMPSAARFSGSNLPDAGRFLYAHIFPFFGYNKVFLSILCFGNFREDTLCPVIKQNRLKTGDCKE